MKNETASPVDQSLSQMDLYHQHSILNASQTHYLQEMLTQYRLDPGSVDLSWQAFFDEVVGESTLMDVKHEIVSFPERARQNQGRRVSSFEKQAVIEKSARLSPVVASNAATSSQAVTSQTAPSIQAVQSSQAVQSLRALMMIRAFRVRGHLAAKLDPLKLDKPKYHPEFDPSCYGFEPSDYTTVVTLDGVLGFNQATIGEVLDKLQKIYCQSVGFEFIHIQDAAQKSWLQERIESGLQPLAHAEKVSALTQIMCAEAFERFLHVKYPGAKRFGIEGGESVMAALEAMITHQVTNYQVEEVIFGMSHRGRLCVLANFLNQPMRYVLAQFKGMYIYKDSHEASSGDVKYHQGYSTDRVIGDRTVHISMLSNPSHLEAVDPVTLGKVRSKQRLVHDTAQSRISGVLIHGDAAFAGQGLVAETLELSALKGYQTGGTIHIIVNNQIGFTTSPPMSRSSPYSSDLAKVIQAPVFHVNGDDPDAVVAVMKLAVDFKQKFQQDVVIDMYCYRRHGHNEGDEPMFTQPIMYKTIMSHPTVATLYQDKLVQCGALTQADITSIADKVISHLNAEFEIATTLDQHPEQRLEADWLQGSWTGVKSYHSSNKSVDALGVSHDDTGCDLAHIIPCVKKAHAISDQFSINLKLKRLLDQRQKMLDGEISFDWGMGEILAFSSLLLEGSHVRLSGQDSGRGTFSHRHSVWVDQLTEQKYVPMNHLGDTQAWFEVVDSPLAEASVLGFEHGYSLADPTSLVIWEAQFGDFANGAQVMIDQFISASEAKWHRLSGLVMMLPHGFEGQGPEHSSARLERYLQMSAHSNWRVMNCTTPANLFHALRGQIHSPFRKPLILMTPKSLLRHKGAVSTLADIQSGTTFLPLITDTSAMLKQAKRHIFCTGKVYYDLVEKRAALGLHEGSNAVSINRVEQLYPFPYEEIEQLLMDYPTADIIWCQEEPVNMGGWTFVDRRFEAALTKVQAKTQQASGFAKRAGYAGRAEACSPATGYAQRHMAEQEKLLLDALVHPSKAPLWI